MAHPFASFRSQPSSGASSASPIAQLRGATLRQIRAAQQHMRRDNSRWTAHLQQVPRTDWMELLATAPQAVLVIDVWRSATLLVQVYEPQSLTAWPHAVQRVSVMRTMVDDRGVALDGLTWDDLQRVKHEIGMGDREAVEIFPADINVVAVAHMRHLWILPAAVRLPFSW